jgi:hypothetical protein
LPAKGERGEGDAGGVDGTEDSGEMEGKIITCCLCMCPIPALFPWRRGLRGYKRSVDVTGQMEGGRGYKKIERHTRRGRSEVYREKNIGIWVTDGRVLRAVVNAQDAEQQYRSRRIRILNLS